MNLNTLKTGDLIVREKGPFSTHYIVWIGWNDGIWVVAENDSIHGVRFTSLEEAQAGKPIKRFEKFGGTENERPLVIQEINRLLGKHYNLMVFNCEHFARWIAKGKMESKQVQTASNLALLLGTAMLASNNNAIRNLGAVCLFGGLLGHGSQH